MINWNWLFMHTKTIIITFLTNRLCPTKSEECQIPLTLYYFYVIQKHICAQTCQIEYLYMAN